MRMLREGGWWRGSGCKITTRQTTHLYLKMQELKLSPLFQQIVSRFLLRFCSASLPLHASLFCLLYLLACKAMHMHSAYHCARIFFCLNICLDIWLTHKSWNYYLQSSKIKIFNKASSIAQQGHAVSWRGTWISLKNGGERRRFSLFFAQICSAGFSSFTGMYWEKNL